MVFVVLTVFSTLANEIRKDIIPQILTQADDRKIVVGAKYAINDVVVKLDLTTLGQLNVYIHTSISVILQRLQNTIDVSDKYYKLSFQATNN